VRFSRRLEVTSFIDRESCFAFIDRIDKGISVEAVVFAKPHNGLRLGCRRGALHQKALK
jgi:hypothetical protein